MIAAATAPWLTLRQGSAPLLLCMPHTGTAIPPEIETRLVSPWLARKDTDWWIERLYDFGVELGASIVRTGMSRTVIDWGPALFSVAVKVWAPWSVAVNV